MRAHSPNPMALSELLSRCRREGKIQNEISLIRLNSFPPLASKSSLLQKWVQVQSLRQRLTVNGNSQVGGAGHQDGFPT